jgi:hypothetical protein
LAQNSAPNGHAFTNFSRLSIILSQQSGRRRVRPTEQIILEWYEDVWIKGNFDRMDDLYQPAPMEECLNPGVSISCDDVRELATVFNSLVSDQRVRIVHCIEDIPWVSAMVEMRGVREGTDEPVYMRWLTMMRIEHGRILESYPSIDFLSFFEQLGQLPDNAFELMLSGTIFK